MGNDGLEAVRAVGNVEVPLDIRGAWGYRGSKHVHRELPGLWG